MTVSPHGEAAIVGVSVRLPGGITTPEDLWNALMAGRDVVTDHATDHPRADVLPAGILDPEDVTGFDREFFDLPEEEVELMDPQQRWLLEGALRAVEDAGIAPRTLRSTNPNRPRTGVWVGSTAYDQLIRNAERPRGLLNSLGSLPGMLASRIAFALDTGGPAEVIDTSCSASLVALDHAVTALETRRVDLAIVGGANILAVDHQTANLREAGAIAKGAQARCRPFSADAEGYVRSEGAVVVVLRRREDAEADGNPIRALVPSSAVNSDGAGIAAGIFHPSHQGQSALLRAAYGRSIPTHEVDYLHAHATGTQVGDGVELHALEAEFSDTRPGDAPLILGALKGNLGHLEGAAGLAAVIAAVLALEAETIPPTINHWASRDDLAESKVLRIATEAEPWPAREHARTVGVSAFGIGGTNAHVVLRAPEPAAPAPPNGGAESERVFLPVSAGSLTALQRTAGTWAPAVGFAPDLEALASTAYHRREHAAWRAVIDAESADAAHQALEALATGQTHPRVVGPARIPGQDPATIWVFCGHGAHHPAMGRQLRATEPVFAQAWDAAAAALRASGHQVWEPGEPLVGMAVTQPAVWCFQIALSRLWLSRGVTPDVVIGHSAGEIAAAHIAGALTLEEAARVIVERSRLLHDAAPLGGLLAIETDAEHAAEIAAGHPVSVATVNGPRSSVLAGPEAVLEGIQEELEARGFATRLLGDATPAHSPLLDEHAASLTTALTGSTGVSPSAATIPLWSTMTGAPIDTTTLDATYWGRQLRLPVRLYDAVHDAVRTLRRRSRASVLFEIAPHPVLAKSLAETVGGEDPPIIVTTRANGEEGEPEGFRRALAETHIRGLNAELDVRRTEQTVRLPPREWARPESHIDRDYGPLTTALAAATTAAERHSAAKNLVLAVLSTTGGQLGAGESLADQGIDSLGAVRAQLRLTTVTGVSIQVRPDTTIEQLAEELVARC